VQPLPAHPPAVAPPSEGEAELYAAIQDDSPDWQQRAFEDFRGLVYQLLLKALGPRAEIEDLAGDVFVRFFESARNIESATGVRSYLVSITMNIVRSEIRRRKYRAIFGWLSQSADEVERRPGPDDPKAKAALLQLHSILEELRAGERMAFVLHCLEGMPLLEVAEVLRVSLSTAKRRVNRASEHLRKRVSRNALLADYIHEKAVKRNV
jgi:RNA polymerase sigma-70 factor, ECF subfamily